MFNKKQYSTKEAKNLSLLYFLTGGFLLVGNGIVFLFEGGSGALYLSSLTAVLFALTGNIHRVRAKRESFHK